MVAAEQGNLEIVEELIRRGASVDLDDIVSCHANSRNMPSVNTPPRTGGIVVILHSAA